MGEFKKQVSRQIIRIIANCNHGVFQELSEGLCGSCTASRGEREEISLKRGAEADQGHGRGFGFYSFKFLVVSSLPPENNEGFWLY